MEVSGDNVGPSLPSNYVTIHDLKQRWLQQQKQKPSLNGGLKLNPKSYENENDNDATSKISNDVVSRSRNDLKSPPTPEVEGKVLDDSKTLIRGSTYKKNNGHNNHPNEEHSQQQQQTRNKNSSRAPRNPSFIAKQNPTGETVQPQPEPVEEMKKKRKKKTKQNRNRNPNPNPNLNEVAESNDETAPVVVDRNVDEEIEKQKPVRAGERRNRNQNQNPKEVRESKEKKTPVVADRNVVDELVVDQNLDEEIKQPQVRPIVRHSRNWNKKEVRDLKHKMTPVVVDQNVVDEVVGVVVAAAAAATVKEINVINVSERNYSNRRGGSSSASGNGRFQGLKFGQRKPPYLENTKGKMSQMWVKKGESVPNSCI